MYIQKTGMNRPLPTIGNADRRQKSSLTRRFLKIYLASRTHWSTGVLKRDFKTSTFAGIAVIFDLEIILKKNCAVAGLTYAYLPRRRN